VPAEVPKPTYSREEVCRLLNLRESVLEGWEANGFVRPLDEYRFRDLVALRTLLALRRSRIRPDGIRAILGSLRERLRNVRDPLSELKIFIDGRRVAVQVDGRRMEPLSGQLLFDFDRDELRRLLQFPAAAAKAAEAREQAARRAEAEQWFQRGAEAEQSGLGIEGAITAYERALALDPELVGAMVNLGTIYYNQRRWTDAERMYRRAIEVQPGYALALFNLGNLFDELGEWHSALEFYLAALQAQPDYADVHYNLALLYQSHGEALKAVRHWRAYLKLDPGGYWAGIARRELSRLRQEALVSGAGAP
jgi:tetratricopeptide (TPR) repeat protein